jgi:Flp pilus assembly CpaF family ATPase
MSVEDALRTALRLGESVLVVGEVRGSEALALFEAMRIGAAGNVVLGTIHGSSSYDTWDRIVNDLKVPSTSFKATDIIVSCFARRSKEGIQRHRRVFCIDEVGKHWKDEPDFITLMQYNSGRDGLLFKDIKKSETLKRVAIMRSMTIQSIMQNIKLRAKIRQMMADADLTDISHVMLANREFTSIAGKGYSGVLPYFRAWVKKLSH